MTTINWLASKAMLASVNISQWTARALDRKVTDEVNKTHGAAADAGRYNKLLIEKEALQPIEKVVNKARVLHIEMTQPWMDTGQRLLPAALYIKYTDQLRELRREFDAEADKFYRDYPAHVEKRRIALNGLFRQNDYPAPEKVRGLFRFDVAILPCPDANDFRVTLAQEHADDIRADIEQRMRRAVDEAMQEPVRRIVETVGHMAERLRGYKPGKRDGVFRNSLVENVRDLVELLPAFNLTGDAAITKITQRMRNELCDFDADTLREDARARRNVAAAAEAILAEAQSILA